MLTKITSIGCHQLSVLFTQPKLPVLLLEQTTAEIYTEQFYSVQFCVFIVKKWNEMKINEKKIYIFKITQCGYLVVFWMNSEKDFKTKILNRNIQFAGKN